ncbi:MAG: TlpA family protein disulfide reductase [Ignavibacteria bacterium]|nr:TlpA family protein disulfide reductase [Ignavibacteria bacterium]MBT8381898.1 TlpA family protein disulfide reductase [Ignavibacteria bacterium]MBT8391076.1 TlpA family protein disulfide reductase [Ignavibacteria bacterium]NNJ54449.1 TlpA family protein disulfide reductase [Ignavibacteriaceae bacterium]NNL21862.1 TlpA family protein disulfide reductase [Ignavibacteriaceae bacterium]
MNKFFTISLLALFVLGFDIRTSAYFEDGNKAPDFQLSTLDGEIIRLSDYLGKIIIVDFWATWCGPCRMAIPELVELQTEHEDELVIIGISLDQPYTQRNLKQFIDQYGINYPIVLGTMEVVQAYGNIRGIPTSFIIDRDGDVVDKFTGYVPKSHYTTVIDPLLSSSE